MVNQKLDLSNRFQFAMSLHQSGKYLDAQKIYLELIQLEPNHFDSLHLLGVSYAQLGQYELAYEYMQKAILIKDKVASLYNNLGNILVKLNRLEDALKAYQRALNLDHKYADAYCNSANTYKALGKNLEAMSRYNQALELNNRFVSAYINRADLWCTLSKFQNAIADCEDALKITPRSDIAYNNLGNALFGLNKLEAAFLNYSRAIDINPNNDKALKNKANVLFHAKKYADAVKVYEDVLRLDPDSEGVYGMYVHAKMMICDWTNFDEEKKQIQFGLMAGKKITTPFSVLALIDDPELHLKVAQLFDPALNSVDVSLPKPAATKKIKVGYFSADFHDHATAYLMAGFFESANKDLFEVYAFSFGDDDQGHMRSRLKQSFDHFYQVKDYSDEEIVSIARDLGLHIAVDLKGHTRGSRLKLFAKRLAPIQISYLGYPGTLGSQCIDYLVADKVLIPDEYRKYYSEKIIYMPDSYQVNDNKRNSVPKNFTRHDCGLPDNGFVYCCFNNSFKITPDIFEAWMKILRSVSGSVLWLLQDNLEAKKNLQLMAEHHGVNSNRLIFAPRMPLLDHLSRHHCADLFLDTMPCNAHTTASDALSQGLPVLTLIGKSFPSRVAASLLTAMGLEELITNSIEDYVSSAIRLANDSANLGAVKCKLLSSVKDSSLFAPSLFARSLEKAYQLIFHSYMSKINFEDIRIIDGVA